MARNIVLCSDGTGSSGTDWKGSNVWKAFRGVVRHEAGESEQLVFYDEGVGTSGLSVKKALGNAFGYGLSQNIRELYTSLAKNYRSGDRIFIYGFSRGAFTARSLAGMIADVGVIKGRGLDPDKLDELVKAAYKAYRSWDEKRGHRLAALKRECTLRDARIHFVGVWDTVDAIGVPVDELRAVIYWIARRFLRPHNMRFNGKTDNMYHALAIDDDRQTFSPDVMKEQEDGRKIEQVWFAGAHTNVGGGYPRQGMSDVAADWMMSKSEECGLRFTKEDRDKLRRDMDVHSTLYDSRSGPGCYYRYLARNVGELTAEAEKIGSKADPRKWRRAGEPVVRQPKARIHVSVMDRCARATADYAPINLPADFEVVGTCDTRCEPDLKKKEDENVEKYKTLLERPESREALKKAFWSDPRDQERGQDPEAWKLIHRRKWLYRLLLVCTAAVAALAVALMVDPDATIKWYQSWSIVGRVWVKFWSGLGGSAPAWLGWLGGGLRTVILKLTPDVLGNLVTGLLRLPEACVAIALIAFGLLKLKKSLLGKMRRLGRETWHKALS